MSGDMKRSYISYQCASIIYMMLDVKVTRDIHNETSGGSLTNPFYKNWMDKKYKRIRLPKLNVAIYTKSWEEMHAELCKSFEFLIEADSRELMDYSPYLLIAYYIHLYSCVVDGLVANKSEYIVIKNNTKKLIDLEKLYIAQFVELILIDNCGVGGDNDDISMERRKMICDCISTYFVYPIVTSVFERHKNSLNHYVSDVKRMYYEQDLYSMWIDLLMRTLLSTSENACITDAMREYCDGVTMKYVNMCNKVSRQLMGENNGFGIDEYGD